MQWVSHASTAANFVDALAESVAVVHAQLGASRPDALFVFVSHHHRKYFDEVPAAVLGEFPGAAVFGCSGAGIIGGGREHEQKPALSVVGAVLPGVELVTCCAQWDELAENTATDQAWYERLGLASEQAQAMILLADPFSGQAESVLPGLDRAYPTAVKVGGLASGGNEPGQLVLFAGDQVQRTGVVILGMAGNIVVDPVVAQGCRPIGTPMFVTRGQDRFIQELDGRVAAQVLRELFRHARAEDRALMQTSLFLGLAPMTDRERYAQGDFLMRPISGLDPHSGALQVGAHVSANSVVQFHVRDAEASKADLKAVLGSYAARGHHPSGALLFSCLGRGAQLYGQPNHDTDELRDQLGEVPVGGFFGNGEFGPVGGVTYLHAYTSAFALFRRSHAD